MRRHLAFAAAFASTALLVESAHAQAHVTCVGDSITAGNGTSSPAATYPAVLQALLGSSFAVENDGRSGTTMLKSGDRPYWSTAEFTRSTTWAAAGGDVVIELGTNDSKPTNWSKKAAFLADCKALVTHYLALAARPRVWVSLVPPATANACCSIDGSAIANEIVPLLRTCAEETGVSSIDVFGALKPFPQLFVDGVHPDDAGARLIAQTVRDALVKLPTVSLSAAPGPSPSSLALSATATAAYGKVEKVVFYEGDVVLDERTGPPWLINLTAVRAGAHLYHAQVVETAGRTNKSSFVTAVIAAGAAATGARVVDLDGVPPEQTDATPDAAPDLPNGCACRSAHAEAGADDLALFGVLLIILSRVGRRRGRGRRGVRRAEIGYFGAREVATNDRAQGILLLRTAEGDVPGRARPDLDVPLPGLSAAHGERVRHPGALRESAGQHRRCGRAVRSHR